MKSRYMYANYPTSPQSQYPNQHSRFSVKNHRYLALAIFASWTYCTPYAVVIETSVIFKITLHEPSSCIDTPLLSIYIISLLGIK